MDVTIQALIDEVTVVQNVEQSAVVALNGIAAQIAAAVANAQSLSPEDRAAIQAAIDGATANTNALAAAVTANTPAVPPAPPA